MQYGMYIELKFMFMLGPNLELYSATVPTGYRREHLPQSFQAELQCIYRSNRTAAHCFHPVKTRLGAGGGPPYFGSELVSHRHFET